MRWPAVFAVLAAVVGCDAAGTSAGRTRRAGAAAVASRWVLA
jgi:hypothetical protein